MPLANLLADLQNVCKGNVARVWDCWGSNKKYEKAPSNAQKAKKGGRNSSGCHVIESDVQYSEVVEEPSKLPWFYHHNLKKYLVGMQWCYIITET